MESLESRGNAILWSILTCRIGGTEADTLSIKSSAKFKKAVDAEDMVRHLGRNHPDILQALQTLVSEVKSKAAAAS
jgi:hypothetical protein